MSANSENNEVSTEVYARMLVYTMLDEVSLAKDCERYYKQQLKAKTIIIIPNWLENCEYPFLWCSQEKRGLGPDRVIKWCRQKIHEMTSEEFDLSLTWFVCYLTLAMEHCLLGEMEEAWACLRKVETTVEVETTKSDCFCQKYKVSVDHIMYATKAHLLSANGQEDMSQQIRQKIIPVSSMTDQNQAGLFATKSHFYGVSEYDNTNMEEELIRKALELDPDNEEWMFILAKLLRTKRRAEHPTGLSKIPEEELSLLEKVVAKTNKCEHLVYLAQAYRESEKLIWRFYKYNKNFLSSELFQSIQDMTEKASKYYMEAYQMNPNCARTLRRVGYGLMNLPSDFADYKVAHECLIRSLEISDHGKTLHILGTFYERFCDNYEKALDCFERAAKKPSHLGLMEMIRMKYILDPEFDPCGDLEDAVKWEVKRSDLTELFAQLGGYHLLVKRDLIKSIEYFSQIMALDRNTPHMTEFNSMCLMSYNRINLFKYLMKECLLYLQQEIVESIREEDRQKILTNKSIVNDFYISIKEKFDPTWINEPLDSIITLHKQSQKLIAEAKRRSEIYASRFNLSLRGDSFKYRTMSQSSNFVNWRSSSSSNNSQSWRNASSSYNSGSWRNSSSSGNNYEGWRNSSSGNNSGGWRNSPGNNYEGWRNSSSGNNSGGWRNSPGNNYEGWRNSSSGNNSGGWRNS